MSTHSLLIAGLVAGVSTSTINVTIDDTSPQIFYSPLVLTAGSPDLQQGWNQYFNGSGFSTFPGQFGIGESAHATSLNGATLSIPFTGAFLAFNRR